MQLSNNIILITGGTSGIGYELGKSFLKKNNTVILLGRNKENLKNAKEKGYQTIQCDLNNINDIENAVIEIQNNFSGLNMLINNAGVQYNYSFSKEMVPLRKIQSEININFTGQVILTQLLIPILANANKAMIINTTSGLGIYPKTDGLVYSASKAAMRNFTIGLRNVLKDTSIKVLEFIPPVTDTNMTEGRNEKKMPVDQLIKMMLPQIEKERRILTVPTMHIFMWIAFLFPGLAQKILEKK